LAEKGSETKPAAEPGSEKAAPKPRRVLKSDTAEKWGHDKFMELEQVPKSSEELVSVYGYDIRDEDNAPRARRRRRYGRGPNKYTRNWEDEEAYQPKPARGGGVVGGTHGRNKSESGEEAFPPLGSNEMRTSAGPSTRGERRPNERRPPREEKENHEQQPRGKRDERDQRPYPEERDNRPQREEREYRGHRDERGPPNRGGGRGRGMGAPFRRGAGDREQHVRSPVEKGGPPRQQANRRSADHAGDDVDRDNSKVNQGGNRDRTYHVGSGRIPSHDGDAATGEGKPKRYSSLRPARGQGQHRGGGQGHQNFYQEFPQDQRGGRPGRDQHQFGSQAFPNTRNSGPPPDAPFMSAASASTVGGPISTQATGTPPYINPAGGILNYGPPPPVPYATVPVTVPIPLVGVPASETLAMIAASHLNQVQSYVTSPAVAVSTQDQVLLAAAAQGQGYAEVRGGVTYFHPQANASLRAAQVSKRPKAAIPIVDPSQVEQGKDGPGQLNGEAKPGDLQLAPTPVSPEAATA